MIDFQKNLVIKMHKDTNIKEEQVKDLFIPGEEALSSYTSGRDFVVFTNKRIISVNTQGISGKKKDYTSMPYSKITAFSVETSGMLDLDSELELYFSGLGKVHFEFQGNCDIKEIGQAISSYVLK